MRKITSTGLSWRQASKVEGAPAGPTVGHGDDQLPEHNHRGAKPFVAELTARGALGSKTPLDRLMEEPTTAERLAGKLLPHLQNL